jgi:acetolactate synthase-1/2/3 large subunit
MTSIGASTSGSTGAQRLIDALCEQGVELVFGYPGGAIMPVYDALHAARERLRHVLVRHEQGAVHAAQGYARASGRVGVCIATSGPGATNFVTGLADALMDSTPLVCVSGQVTSENLGTEAFQEADVIGLTLGATKWSYQVTRAEEIPAAVARAFEVATDGRPGPVLLEITKDAQFAEVESDGHGPPTPVSLTAEWRYPRAHADLEGIERAAALINQAERPYLIVGQGVLLSGACEALRAVAERADIPIAATLLGLSAVASDHPLLVGMVGMHGNYGANMLTNEADVIVAVGMRFDDRVTGRLDGYAPQARIVHIEIDPAEVNRRVPAEIALVADARAALEALLPHLEPARHEAWRTRFSEHDRTEYQAVVEAELHPVLGALRMGEVVARLAERSDGDAVIVSDVGQHQMAVARHSRFTRPDSHITSGGLGTMGFALPAAIGARLAAPERSVVAVVGDGGFQMTMQELGTLMQERVPVKIVVLNNEHLGMVRQWQELFFDGRYSEVALHNPDFVMLCKAFGIPARTVAERAELDHALDDLLAAEGPALLEVRVGRTDNIFPIIPAGAAVDEMRLS